MSPLEVEGGSHGTAANLEALETASARLQSAAGTVAHQAPLVAEVSTSPLVQAAERCVPVDAAASLVRARLELTASGGPLGRAASLERLSLTLRAAVWGYRRVDAEVEALWAGAGDLLGFSVGTAVGGVATIPAAAGSLPVVAAVAAASALRPSLQDPATWRGVADRAAFDHPQVLELLASGLDGSILGSATSPLGALAWTLAAARAGVPWPPRTPAEALRLIRSIAGGTVLDDRAPVAVRAGETKTVDGARGVADLVALQSEILPARTVRVQRVEGPQGGAWLLHVPGTTSWAATPGENPFDLTTNVALMTGDVTGTMRAAQQALDDATRRRGTGADDPVMVVGYSQGGMTAAALAAHPGFTGRHRVTHVVTVGAPVARVPIPSGVQVLSLEHTQDAVPRLDGRANPDRPSWTTARRDVRVDPDVDGRASAAHGTRAYRVTAQEVDRSDDPSLRDWRVSSRRFLGSGGPLTVTETDYEVRRLPVGPGQPRSGQQP